MNITNEKPVMIFKKEYNGYINYSVGLSKKNQDGSYTNGYIQVRFKNGAILEDKTTIYIKKAWLSFYLKDKKTIPYIFINEFETIEQAINNAKTSVTQTGQVSVQVEDPFKSFGEEVVINEEDLPF